MSGSTDLDHEVTQLLSREVILLDRHRWEEWLDLFTEDAVYWVPSWASEEETTTDPELELNLIYLKDRGGLEDRVFRIETGDSYASVPLDRTVHIVSNIIVEKADGDTIEVAANCIVHSFGKKGGMTRASQYEFILKRIDGALKIARKKITFIDDRIEGAVDIYHL